MYGDCEPTREEWAKQCRDAEEKAAEGAAYNQWVRATKSSARIERFKVDPLELHQLSARRTCQCDIEFAQEVEQLCALRWGIALKDRSTK